MSWKTVISKGLHFITVYIAEAEKQQLSHALKVLSETEKQLRMSKNQTTWLTAALLQLSSVSSSVDAKDGSSCLRTVYEQGGDDMRDTLLYFLFFGTRLIFMFIKFIAVEFCFCCVRS